MLQQMRVYSIPDTEEAEAQGMYIQASQVNIELHSPIKITHLECTYIFVQINKYRSAHDKINPGSHILNRIDNKVQR